MYLELQQRLLTRVRALIQDQYGIELGPIAIEQPPDLRLGEFALPVAFELARRLRKAPKIIATELATLLNNASKLPLSPCLSTPRESRRARHPRASKPQAQAISTSISIAGCLASALAQFDIRPAPNLRMHVLVEHTSINPNKAAHVGPSAQRNPRRYLRPHPARQRPEGR